jgi:hypothetical protein
MNEPAGYWPTRPSMRSRRRSAWPQWRAYSSIIQLITSGQIWLIAAFLLEASARDALDEREAAGRALERGLDLAEPAGQLFPVPAARGAGAA